MRGGSVVQERDEVRAADSDREAVAERLRGALNEGRLSLSEYDERLQQAYASRTYGELDRLLADLPDQSGAISLHKPAPVGRPGGPVPAVAPTIPGWLAAIWGAWLVAVLVNVAIWAAVSLSAGQWIYFWPIWVAGPWGAILLARTLSGMAGGGLHHHDEERDARRAARRARRDAHDAARRARRDADDAARRARRQARRGR